MGNLALAEKPETPEEVDNMAKETEQTPPLTMSVPDFVRLEVRTEIAEGFGKINAGIAERFGKHDAVIAERFGKHDAAIAERFGKQDAAIAEQLGGIKTEIAEGFGKVNTQNAERSNRIIGTIIGSGILIVGLIGLIVNWPF